MYKGLLFGVMVLSFVGAQGDEVVNRCVRIYLEAMSSPTWQEKRQDLLEEYPQCQTVSVFDELGKYSVENNNAQVAELAFREKHHLQDPLTTAWRQLPARTKEAVGYWTLGSISGAVLGAAAFKWWSSR